VTLKPGLGSLEVIGTDTYRSATCDFLLTLRGNHGPISHRFRGKRRFQSKMHFFPPPVFCAMLKGFPLELGIGAFGVKKTRMMEITSRKKFDDIFSPLDTTYKCE